MNEIKPYLCGGINGLSDSDAKDWREHVKATFPAAIDPMRRDYRGREAENVREIVEGDLLDIQMCDVVIANCARPSWGTGMEIFYAASAGKLVVAIVPDLKTASPWLRHHATLVATVDAAIAFVRELFQ